MGYQTLGEKRAWRAKNKDHINDYQRKYRAKNRERYLEYLRVYYRGHKAQFRQYNRDRRNECPDCGGEKLRTASICRKCYDLRRAVCRVTFCDSHGQPHRHCVCGWPIALKLKLNACHICIAEQRRIEFKARKEAV